MNEERIWEINERVTELAKDIIRRNPENVQELKEFYGKEWAKDMDEILRDEGKRISEFAVNLIEEWGLDIYDRFYYNGVSDAVLNLLTAKDEEDFIRKYEEYEKYMEEWQQEEREKDLVEYGKDYGGENWEDTGWEV